MQIQIASESSRYLGNIVRTSRGVYSYKISRKTIVGRGLSADYPIHIYADDDFRGSKAEVIEWVSDQINRYENS
jgi:hypothetical protein